MSSDTPSISPRLRTSGSVIAPVVVSPERQQPAEMKVLLRLPHVATAAQPRWKLALARSLLSKAQQKYAVAALGVFAVCLVLIVSHSRRHQQPERAMPRVNAVRAEFVDLVLNRPQMSIEKNHRPLSITKTEYRILELLIDHAEHYISAEQLVRYATGHAVDRGNLKVHMSRIRHKLAVAGGVPLEIRVYPRFGYMLTGRSMAISEIPNVPETVASDRQHGMKLGSLDDLAVAGLQSSGGGQQ